MAEEQRCQEGHRPCANNCGFFGSPATLNLCSKCYRDHRLKEEEKQQPQQAASSSSSSATAAEVVVEESLCASSSSSPASFVGAEAGEPSVLVASATAAAATETEKKGPNRCAKCRKRVGLTAGFRCRCGATYCGTHRHAEQHGCTFDFKAAGRAAIARANPVVRAVKLHKI